MKKRINTYTLPRNLYKVFLDLVPRSKTKPFHKSNIQIINIFIRRVRTGCQYRELGADWKSVYYRIKKWEELGIIDKLLELIQRHLNLFLSEEYILIMDTQSIANTKYSHEKGYDANKKISGLKRCPFVGIKGELLDMFVYPASDHERTCLEKSLESLQARKIFENAKITIFADKGFFGKEYIKKLELKFGVTLKIMIIDYHDINKVNANTKNKWKDMHPIAKQVYIEEGEIIKKKNKQISIIRQVVEHFFAWLRDYRILNFNYERYFKSHRTACIIAAITILFRKAEGSSTR